MSKPQNRSEEALALHKQLKGKIGTKVKAELTPDNLALLYTPGVGAASRAIAEDPQTLRDYTMVGNTVAVISDGSAVLGLGNIGPGGALPVMEGKALLFKTLADVDAVPLVLDTQDTEEIIAAVKAVAPNFGGINLEDISAPRCYEIERRLQAELPIPVMHDDQHATAIVTLAGLINATKITGRRLQDSKVVIIGAGAAGNALVRLLNHYGVKDIYLFDSKGLVSDARDDLDPEKAQLVELTAGGNRTDTRDEVLNGADIVVGVSMPDQITPAQVKTMAKDPIVFALANPDPEILPDDAHAAGAAVTATGRSDFPNQINNVLVFPGIFRGLLDSGAQDVTLDIKTKAAEAIAGLVENPTPEEIVPTIFDERVAPAVAKAVAG